MDTFYCDGEVTMSDAAEIPAAHPVNAWKLREQVLTFETLPRLMAIVNVTPDSFSDGGKFLEASSAVDHALQLVEEGAEILDIGGESTRPYSDIIAVEEEWRRVEPVIKGLVAQTKVPLSIDTSKADVARRAVDAGVQIINDVSGFRDPAMVDVAVESGCGLCVMHMQGTPQTMQDDPQYVDVVSEVSSYLAHQRDLLVQAGVEQERICLDPGIGFGKKHLHNRQLLQQTHQLHRLQQPILIGHSRKGFIAKELGDSEFDRLYGNLGVSLAMAQQRVQLLRVHDIWPVAQALKLFEFAGGTAAIC